MNNTFGASFKFRAPAKDIHPELQHLMSANPTMTCLHAGTSNLGQATFKMIKNVNLMRFLQSKGEQETNQKFD